MRKLERALHIVDSVNQWAGRIVGYLLIILMAITVWEVISRYIFNAPTSWVFEISQFIQVGIAALAGGVTMLHKEHVRVELLVDVLRPRMRLIMDLMVSLLFFAVIIVFMYETGVEAIDSISIREHSDSSFAPIIYPVKLAVFVGVVLVFLQGVVKFIRDALRLVAHSEHALEK